MLSSISNYFSRLPFFSCNFDSSFCFFEYTYMFGSDNLISEIFGYFILCFALFHGDLFPGMLYYMYYIH